MVVVMKHATRALLLLSCYGWAACASAKRLITFGDSITDNGNGTNSYVQAYFSQLLGQNITAPYPPGPFFSDGRWSNGPVWAEYVADKTNFQLVDMAIGSSTTNKTTSFHGVGDFYPSSLLSNKRGARNVSLPTLTEAVDSFLSKNKVYPDDVIVIESGINDILGFFEANILTTLTYAEDASSENTTIPQFVVQDVATAIRDALERLYSAGARRFAVWDLCAGEAVPLAHTLNNLMNTVNAILQGIRALDARQNALRDFTKTFVDAANLALEDVVKSFSTAHQDAGVISFPFATIQRGFVSNYGQLGFVNAESGCASDLAISQYSTGNLYSLANPTFTADGAKATLTLSPFLTQKLNKLGSDLYGANGQQNTPRTTADFIERLRSIFASYLDDSNTLGHLTGYILTSQPLTKGGLSPYDVVPTCFLQSADHLFHDEVHPTTKQHQLLAQAFLTYAQNLFQ